MNCTGKRQRTTRPVSCATAIRSGRPVGRSSSPTGPFRDINGTNLCNYGSGNGDPNAASTALTTEGNDIGPGHFGYLNDNGQHPASIHYYDGITADGWPRFTRKLNLSDSSSSSSSSSGTSSSPSSDAAPLADGRDTIVARHSARAMEIADASTDNDANVRQGTPDGGTHQQFDVNAQVDGVYSVRPVHSSKSLDVYHFNTEAGGNIAQREYWGGETQQFEIRRVGGQAGFYGRVISVILSSQIQLPHLKASSVHCCPVNSKDKCLLPPGEGQAEGVLKKTAACQ